MKPLVAVLVVLVPALVAGCAPEEHEPSAAPSAETVWFEPVEREVGVDFEHVAGTEIRYWFPEIFTGGVAFLDADGDGWLDLYLVQGGELDPDRPNPLGNQFFLNRGDGTFEDATEASGLGDRGYGMGVACGDVEGDGDVDVFVSNVGPNALYLNQGDGTFQEVASRAGVDHPGWGTSAVFADYDSDGDLDLFLTNYVNWSIGTELTCRSTSGERDYCAPEEYKRPAMDVLYRNEGDGSFRDVSEEVGLQRAFGTGLGVVAGDFDQDGRCDFYVANDGMPNQLWIQQPDGTLRDRALLTGSAVNRQGAPEAGMGVAAVDIDQDGWEDLFLSHLRNESNTFYQNRRGVFADRTSAVGLAGPSIRTTGFGLGFADFDHDGRLDLYVANGRVMRFEPILAEEDPYAEPDQLYRGLEGGRFEVVGANGGLRDAWNATSRGAALGDFDGDGDVDVAVVARQGPMRLLANRAGEDRNWALLRVLGSPGVDALGARLEVHAGGRVQHRTVRSGFGYCASHDPRVHVGLDRAERIDEVRVHWPDGARESFGPLPGNGAHELLRGSGRALE